MRGQIVVDDGRAHAGRTVGRAFVRPAESGAIGDVLRLRGGSQSEETENDSDDGEPANHKHSLLVVPIVPGSRIAYAGKPGKCSPGTSGRPAIRPWQQVEIRSRNHE